MPTTLLSISTSSRTLTFVKKQLPHLSFIPLADVPDLIWKKTRGSVPGGRDTAPNVGPEHPNHFADGDEPNPARRNVTLRNFSLADPQNNLTPKAWFDFYRDLYEAKGQKKQHPSNKYGLLPFRVWQIFDLMVDYAKTGKLPQFVCAAGVLAHYVGDACQPLHGSYLADGYSDQPTSGTKAQSDELARERAFTALTKTTWSICLLLNSSRW